MQDDLDKTERDKRKLDKQKEQQREQRAEQNDIVALMSTDFGRRVMHRTLSEARVFHPTFTPGDPHMTSFNEGKRTIGLWLLAQIIQLTPDQYALMMKEANDA